MTNHDRNKIKINKENETRTKEISKMINEGGIGADKYYEIEKNSSLPRKGTDNDREDQ